MFEELLAVASLRIIGCLVLILRRIGIEFTAHHLKEKCPARQNTFLLHHQRHPVPKTTPIYFLLLICSITYAMPRALATIIFPISGFIASPAVKGGHELATPAFWF